MDIGRVQRRFTAEPVDRVVPRRSARPSPAAAPATPEAPVERVEHADHLEPTTATADARS